MNEVINYLIMLSEYLLLGGICSMWHYKLLHVGL